MNTTTNNRREAAMTTTTIPTTDNRGLLATGTVLPDGAVIESTTYTGYLVTTTEGDEFRSFDQVHGRPAPVMPLVRLG